MKYSKYSQSSPVRAHGFTLVELMVALVIGLFITAVMVNVFFSTRKTSVLQENLSRVQEAGRFATEFLAYDIRMAGYTGCRQSLASGSYDTSAKACDPTLLSVCSIASDTTIPTTFNTVGLTGHSYSGSGGQLLTDWTPNLPATFFSNGMVEPFTDVIVIQRASSLGTHLTGNTGPTNGNIQVVETAELAGQLNTGGGDVLMVSDCKNADIFVSTNASNGSGKTTIAHGSGPNANIDPALSHSYDVDAELYKLVSRAYFIGRRDATANRALMRRELVTSKASNSPVMMTQELVEGVASMLVGYGIDTTGDGDRIVDSYVRAASVPAWGAVKSVRVGLLGETLGTVEMSPDTTVYALGADANDSSFNAGPSGAAYNDQRRRQVFTITVQRRNTNVAGIAP